MRYIFDLDGTLADCSHRLHYLESRPKDWTRFFEACEADKPIWPMLNTLRILADNSIENKVEIWSGRNESVRQETLRWLMKVACISVGRNLFHTIRKLRMRPEHDYRQDYVLKREWLEQERIACPNDPIDVVFEDRERVAAMWRSEGIMCCQVAEGNF